MGTGRRYRIEQRTDDVDAPGEYCVHPHLQRDALLREGVPQASADGDDHGKEHQRVCLVLRLRQVAVGDVHEPTVDVGAVGWRYVRAAVVLPRALVVVRVRVGFHAPGARLSLPADLLVGHAERAVLAPARRVILDHPRDDHRALASNRVCLRIQRIIPRATPIITASRGTGSPGGASDLRRRSLARGAGCVRSENPRGFDVDHPRAVSLCAPKPRPATLRESRIRP